MAFGRMEAGGLRIIFMTSTTLGRQVILDFKEWISMNSFVWLDLIFALIHVYMLSYYISWCYSLNEWMYKYWRFLCFTVA